MKRLTNTQIEKALSTLSTWGVNKKGTEIKKTFKTKNFLGGLSFIAKIVVHAEILNHHPTVELQYSSVTVKLTTHDVDGLSKLDIELAKRIDSLGA